MYDKAAMNNTTLSTAEALNYLQSKVPAELHEPVIGIICGSGLNGLAESVLPEPRCEVPYANVPHFPLSTGKANTSGKLQYESNAKEQDSAWPCRQTSLWFVRAEQNACGFDGRQGTVSLQ